MEIAVLRAAASSEGQRHRQSPSTMMRAPDIGLPRPEETFQKKLSENLTMKWFEKLGGAGNFSLDSFADVPLSLPHRDPRDRHIPSTVEQAEVSIAQA